MSIRNAPSRAMLDLCNRANALGRDTHGERWKQVTPRKIERWLNDNLLPQPRRPGRGRGKGRDAIYTDHHVTRAVDIAALIKRYRSADSVALVLFARNQEIPWTRVQAAYLGCVDTVEARARALQQSYSGPRSDPTPEDIADSVEQRVARVAGLPIKGAGSTAKREAFTNMWLRLLLAAELAEEDVAAGLQAIGVPADFAVLDGTPFAPDRLLPAVRPANLRALIKGADEARMLDAMRAWRLMARLLTAIPDELAPAEMREIAASIGAGPRQELVQAVGALVPLIGDSLGLPIRLLDAAVLR